jgi:hypothetical protein
MGHSGEAVPCVWHAMLECLRLVNKVQSKVDGELTAHSDHDFDCSDNPASRMMQRGADCGRSGVRRLPKVCGREEKVDLSFNPEDNLSFFIDQAIEGHRLLWSSVTDCRRESEKDETVVFHHPSRKASCFPGLQKASGEAYG